MIKRWFGWMVVALVSLVVIVGLEVVLALRRDYLPTAPAFEISGTFGPPSGRPLRFVVLGDSTAAGLGAASADDSYAARLARRLGNAGWKVEMTGYGVSGARVADVLEEQVALAEQAGPDLVFVGIGANDATHLTSLGSVRSDMAEVLDRLEATGAAVVVAGAPDMRAAAWHEPLRSIAGWRGRRVSAAIASAARSRSVPVVPLAERTGPFFDADPEAHYGADDFHPGSLGYLRWADAIYPYLEEVLGAP